MDYQFEYLDKNPTLHVKDAYIKFRELKRELDKIISVNSLLDVGCGVGVLTRMLSEYFHPKEIVAVDISKAAIDMAKNLNKDSKIKFENYDIFDLKMKKKFDLIVGADIIEHVGKDVAFLTRLKSLGKKIVIRLPLEDSLLNRLLKDLKLSNEWNKTEDRYGHVNHYDVQSFFFQSSTIRAQSIFVYPVFD